MDDLLRILPKKIFQKGGISLVPIEVADGEPAHLFPHACSVAAAVQTARSARLHTKIKSDLVALARPGRGISVKKIFVDDGESVDLIGDARFFEHFPLYGVFRAFMQLHGAADRIKVIGGAVCRKEGAAVFDDDRRGAVAEPVISSRKGAVVCIRPPYNSVSYSE